MTSPVSSDAAIDAYLAAFAAHGFARATLAHAARNAEASAADIAALVAGRWDALDRFNRRLDLAALAAFEPDAGASTRDQLFDLVMARFDAARPHRAACMRLALDARRQPGLALALAAQLGRTANMLLGAADVVTTGPLGIARINGFAALLADVGRAWLGDDDADQGATMRALDRRLDQAERLQTRPFGRSRRDHDGEDIPAAAI